MLKELLHRWRSRALALAFGAFPGLARRFAARLRADAAAVPWSPATKPLRSARLVLITTGGVHLRSQPPFDMVDKNGDPSWREIPADAPAAELTITHDYYNHRDADADFNLVLPLERLREAEAQGALGSLHPVAFSFMGHIDGPHVETLTRRLAPELAQRLRRERVDLALLVPA